MKVAETVFLNMAMANLNVALDRTCKLLDTKKFPLRKRDSEWSRLICSYSRCIHVNVWRDRVSKEYVNSKIIPLLRLAKEQVSVLLESDSVSGEDKNQIKWYSENVRLREGNLFNCYLNDLDSRFPVDTIEPRFAVPC